jgi:hypothetical protein
MARWGRHGGGLHQQPPTCVWHIIKGMMCQDSSQPTRPPPMRGTACGKAACCLETAPNSHSAELCRLGSSLTRGDKCCILQNCPRQCTAHSPHPHTHRRAAASGSCTVRIHVMGAAADVTTTHQKSEAGCWHQLSTLGCAQGSAPPSMSLGLTPTGLQPGWKLQGHDTRV